MTDLAVIQADIDAMLASPCTSTWLFTALRNALDRDCLDAAADAEALSTLLGRRCDALLESALQMRAGEADMPAMPLDQHSPADMEPKEIGLHEWRPSSRS